MRAEFETLVKSFHGFFHIYLPKQKCYSANTIDSYKVAFNLFLDYMMEELQLPLYKMTLEDLSREGNKTRTVPLMNATVKHLMNYLKLFHPNYPECGNNYLFYTISHGQTHQMSRDTVAFFMKKYGEAARKICPDIPLQVHPHQLRHTRAIHLYRGGMPLALLSEFLGHVSVETTRIYAYADTEVKRDAIEKATPKT